MSCVGMFAHVRTACGIDAGCSGIYSTSLGLKAPAQQTAQLCWRGTFIDGPAEGAACQARPRARSVPGCTPRRCSATDIFEAERAYVEALEQRTEKAIGFSRQTSPDDASTGLPSVGAELTPSEAFWETASTETPPKASPKPASPPWDWAKVTPHFRGGPGTAGGNTDEKPIEPRAPPAGPASQAVAEALLRAKVKEGQPPLKSLAQEAMPMVMSGTVGHPFLCQRPCLFLAKGSCTLGEDCNFCHLPHARETHLDKWNRELLHALSFPERFRATLPILKEKVAQLQLGRETETFLDILSVAAGRIDMDEQASQEVHPRRMRALLAALRSQNLRALLATLCTGLPQLCKERDAANELCQRLKERLVAAQNVK